MASSGGGASAVWVDFGGVLTPPVVETLGAFCERVGATPEELGTAMFAVAQRYGTTDIMEPLDTPLVGEEEWTRQVQEEIESRFERHVDLSDFAAKWFHDRPPNAELVEYLGTLRERGLFVGMLSNMVPAFEPHWRRMISEQLFDDLVFSYQVGVRKPSREVYELAAQRAGAPAGACVLVDDLPQNCEGARAAGWHAVHFQATADAIEELERLLAR